MAYIWFIVALVFFILWLTKAPKPKDGPDEYSRGYHQGRYDAEHPSPVSQSPHYSHAPVASGARVVDDFDDELDDSCSGHYGTAPHHTQAAHPIATPYVAPAPKPHNPAQTLNAVLYLASFLLVAAAAALIAASMPSSVKLAGLIAVVVLFYGAGLVLYKTVTILRPAAVAFIGTGLAILPFVGFALTAFTGISASAAWVIISLIGLVAYFNAAIALKSQVISYLTLGFVLSLSCSFVALVPVGFVWYFVALIVVSLIASIISYFKPAWVPTTFSKPIEQTGLYVTPVALGASLLAFLAMDAAMYEIVFSVATLQYLVSLLQKRTQTYETTVRVMVHITLLIFAGDIWNGDFVAFGTAWLILAVAQAAYSLLRVRQSVRSSYATEATFLLSSIALLLIGLSFWASSPVSDAMSLLNWILIGAIGIAAAFKFRSPHWGYATLATSLVVPAILTQSVIQPAMPKEVLVVLYVMLAGAATLALIDYQHRSNALHVLLYSSIGVWFAAALTFAGLTDSPALWLSISFAAGAAIATGLSLITTRPSLIIVAGVSWYAAVAALLSFVEVPAEWYALSLGGFSALGIAAASYVFHNRSHFTRRSYLAALGAGAFATSIAGITYGHTTATLLTFGLFAVIAILALGQRITRPRDSSFISVLIMVTYLTYGFLLWAIGLVLGGWWLVLAYVVAAIVLWVASHIEKVSWLILGANASILAATALTFEQLGISSNWAFLYVIWVAAIVYGATYAYYRAQGDAARQWLSGISVWAVTLVGAMSGLGSYDDAYRIAAAFTLGLTGGAAIIHGLLIKRTFVLEIAIYIVNLAIQFIIAITYPDLSFVLYTYWWAVVILMVAYYFKTNVEGRAMVAMGIVTFIVAGYVLTSGGIYSLLFLVQSVAMAGAGAVYQKRWVIWWGVIASVAAIIYFLRDYLYIWLALLGLFLIGIVVWRLIVIGKRD